MEKMLCRDCSNTKRDKFSQMQYPKNDLEQKEMEHVPLA